MSPAERTNVVTLRLTDEEHVSLVQLAEAEGVSFSDVLRALLRGRAALVLGRAKQRRRGSAHAEVGLEPYTVVHDPLANRAIMRIDGHVFMPVGGEIELTNPNVNARVTRVRLLAGNPAVLCLDVITTPDR